MTIIARRTKIDSDAPDPTQRRAGVVEVVFDSASRTTPVDLDDGVIVRITNDALGTDGEGAGNIEGYSPPVWADDEIKAALFLESWQVRLNMTLTKLTQGAATIEGLIDIGPDDGSSPIIVARDNKPFDKPQFSTETRSFYFSIYCLDTFIANGGKIYARATGADFTAEDISLAFWRIG
jgi:hypothetical protein